MYIGAENRELVPGEADDPKPIPDNLTSVRLSDNHETTHVSYSTLYQRTDRISSSLQFKGVEDLDVTSHTRVRPDASNSYMIA